MRQVALTVFRSSALFAAVVSGAPVSFVQASAPAVGHSIATVENLSKHAEVSSMSLSPDGKTIAVSTPTGDYSAALMLLDAQTLKPVGAVKESPDLLPGPVAWASNDRLIISLVRKYGGFAKPSLTGELIGVNRDGKAMRALFGAYRQDQFAQLQDPLIDDAKFALIALNHFDVNGSFTELHRINELRGNTVRLARAPLRNGLFMLDANQQARFAYGEDIDGKRKVYRLARAKDGGFSDARVNKNWLLVCDQAKDGFGLVPIAFVLPKLNLASSSKAASASESFYAYYMPASGPVQLVRVDAETLNRTVLYAPKLASPENVLMTADAREVYAIKASEAPGGLFIVNESAPEAIAYRAFAKSFPGAVVTPVNFSRDGARAIFYVAASNDSGSYFLYQTTARTAKFLMPVNTWLVPEHMAKTHSVRFTARDGLAIEGFLTLPVSAGARAQAKLPLVVLPHGGPYGVYDSAAFDPWSQVLAANGYAVLKVNFRGSGGYGDKFIALGHREWGRAMQNDVTDATRWAIAQGIADPARIAIVGASYGGYAALMGGALEPKLYKAVISYVGVSDLNLLRSAVDIQGSESGTRYLDQVLGTDAEELTRRSPVNLAAHFEAPVLIIHGGRDSRVPIKHGQSMRDALKAAGKNVEFFSVEDESHGFYKEKNVAEGYQRMLAFLAKNLAPPAVAVQ
jgi:dipeptidyl aminopeptidase/acylaminoacyl peptidase